MEAFWRSRKREAEAERVMDILLVVLGVLILGVFWVMLHDTTHFETTEYCVTDPRIRKAFRAVVLADLHNQRYGRDNQLLLKAIRDGRPDIVLIAGDMLTARPGKDFTPAIDLIRELSKEYPIYYGVGNHEHRIRLCRQTYGSMGRDYVQALRECGVKLMCNERRTLEEYGVDVVGSQIHHRYYQRWEKRPMAKNYLPRTLGEPDSEHYTILLAHNPDYVPEYAAWGADLTLSGHVHGGVARVPFWNHGVISPSMKLFPKYDGGLFDEGKAHMILSRGLGCHTIPIRLFNPGDLIFLQFQPAQDSTITKLGKKNKTKKQA